MWEKKPVLLLLLATAAILAGTIITMVMPFAWVNTEQDRIASVKPYTPLQLAGRDVYIREGCNNCHSQTVRPLVAEVLRYGEYSKAGEFVFDRPHLWGSRRMGPDLARVGGKYPDSWQTQHLKNPVAMFPESNMPAYAFLAGNRVDPEYTRRKMAVLSFPYEAKQIAALTGASELDALVAYLQKLGSDIPWRAAAQTAVAGELKNPYGPEPAFLFEGKKLFEQHCAVCHGQEMAGDIGPDLSALDLDDAEDYMILLNGRPDGGMPGFAQLGAKKLWLLVNYLKYHGVGR